MRSLLRADHVAVPALVPSVRSVDRAVASGHTRGAGQPEVSGGHAGVGHRHSGPAHPVPLPALPALGGAVLHQGDSSISGNTCPHKMEEWLPHALEAPLYA